MALSTHGTYQAIADGRQRFAVEIASFMLNERPSTVHQMATSPAIP